VIQTVDFAVRLGQVVTVGGGRSEKQEKVLDL